MPGAIVAAVVGPIVLVIIAGDALDPGPPASVRFAGVSVSVSDPAVSELPGAGHRLIIAADVVSPQSLPDGLAFALDSPWRRFAVPRGGRVPRGRRVPLGGPRATRRIPSP